MKPKLNFPGTLEEKFTEIKKNNSKINRTRARGIRESETLDLLLLKRHELEDDIFYHLIDYGEKLQNPLLDYCFRNFLKSSCKEPSVFDRIPNVKEFAEQIKNYKGQKILVRNDPNLKTGIVSGPCKFEIEKSFRKLYVPVDKLIIFDAEYGEDWKDGNTNNIWIDHRIFEYLQSDIDLHFISPKGVEWHTDFNRRIWIGGGPPKDIHVYIGNKLVNEELKYIELTIETKKTIKVPSLLA